MMSNKLVVASRIINVVCVCTSNRIRGACSEVVLAGNR